jgi:hypothetical protein
MLLAIGTVLIILAGICGLAMAYFSVISLIKKDFPAFLMGAVFFIINTFSVVGYINIVFLAK